MLPVVLGMPNFIIRNRGGGGQDNNFSRRQNKKGHKYCPEKRQSSSQLEQHTSRLHGKGCKRHSGGTVNGGNFFDFGSGEMTGPFHQSDCGIR